MTLNFSSGIERERERERESKRLRRFVTTSFLILSLILQNFLFLVNPIYAASTPWAQSDWSAGNFSASSGVSTSTPNQITLSPTENLSNTGFETDLTGWNTAAYTLNDQFTTTTAAGSVNGTQAEPTGGTRTVTDTNSKISIGSTVLNFATGAVANNGIWYSSSARSAGKILLTTLTPADLNGVSRFGWDTNTSGNINDSLTLNTGTIYINANNIDAPSVGSFTATGYQLATIMRSSGMFYFIKGGTFTNWTLMYTSTLGNAAGIPAINIGNTTAPSTADNIRIPTSFWLPTPIVSDGFSGATTDGLGHAEANGGNGLTWTDSIGTWQSSSNVASATALTGGVAIRTLTATAGTNALIDVNLTRSAGVGGIVFRYQDSTNYLIAYYDGTNAKVDKVIAGVTTNVISHAETYSAGATLRVITDGTAIRFYYNNVLVGTGTITNFATSVLHGLYTTDTGNTFDNFIVWPRSGYAVPDTDITATRNTGTKYAGTASVQLIAPAGNDANYTQNLITDTNTYALSAYAYTGAPVTTNDLNLYSGTGTITTTFTPVDGGNLNGWYKLTGILTGSASSTAYGVMVKAGKTVYVDDLSLNNYTSGTLTSSIFDAGYSATWGTLTYSATTPAGTTVTVKVRAGNSPDLSDATVFGSCTAISSGSSISANACASGAKRYAQYLITLTSTTETSTPTFSTFSAVFNVTPISIQNRMVAKPTNNSVTILVKTNISSDVTVDYGLTAGYGNTAISTNATINEVLISSLSPSATYHYKVTVSENNNSSNTTSTSDSTFKTQLEAGNSFSAAIISDMQSCNISNTITQVGSVNPDIILTIGDNVGGEYANTVSEFQNRWKIDFFDYIQNLTNHIPVFTTLGNHDAAISNFNNGISAYQLEVSMPTSDTGGEKYYSFDYGDAHFSILNGTHSGDNDGTIDSTQLTWLQNDLQSTSKKYKFVFDHFLVYGVDDTYMTNTWRLSNYTDLHNILKNNGVLAYFDGHRHVYNRYVKDGVFYITNPTAGVGCILNGIYGNDNYANVGGDTGTIANAFGNYIGFTKLSVSSSRASVVIYKNDGTTIDSFDLTPANFELSTPLSSGYTNDSTPIFTWNASSDNASGLSKYQLYIDGSLNRDDISSATTSTTPTSDLSDGAHTWYIKAVNNAGWATQSASTYTINVDLTNPTVSLSNPANNYSTVDRTPTLSWSGSDASSGIASYALYIDNVLVQTNLNTSYTPTDSLSCGNHSWYVRATDTVANYTNADTRNFSVSCGRGNSGMGIVTPVVIIPTPTITPTPTICPTGNLFSTTTGLPCTSFQIIPVNTTIPSPSSGPSVYNFGPTTLKFWSKGELVKELQRFLNKNLNLNLKIDGILGLKTIAVIKKWQKANGLVADGLVGAKTKAKMNGVGR